MNNPQKTHWAEFAALLDSFRAFVRMSTISFGVLLSGLLSPRALRPILLPVRSRRRGAGMLEYALIAALAVGIFLILRTFFDGLFSDVTNDIKKNLEDPVPGK